MAKYSAQLKAKSAAGKSITTTISNVNPETNASYIKQFAQKLNGLTTNTYEESNYIITSNLDTEDPPITPTDKRPTPTITFSNVPTLAQAKNGTYMGITYTGDGQLYAYTKSGLNAMLYAIVGNGTQMMIGGAPNSSGQTAGTIVIGAFGTDNYKPVEAEVNIE